MFYSFKYALLWSGIDLLWCSLCQQIYCINYACECVGLSFQVTVTKVVTVSMQQERNTVAFMLLTSLIQFCFLIKCMILHWFNYYTISMLNRSVELRLQQSLISVQKLLPPFYFPRRHKRFKTARAHFEDSACLPVHFQLWAVCETASSHSSSFYSHSLPAPSSLISLSLCPCACLCVELAKQAHRLKPFIHLCSLQLLSWQPRMTGRKQTAVSELQSTRTLQSTNTLLWADEELWYWDTEADTDCEVSHRGRGTGLSSTVFTFLQFTVNHVTNAEMIRH